MRNALQYKVSDYFHVAFAQTNNPTPITRPDSNCLYLMKSLLLSNHVLTIGTDFGEAKKYTNGFVTNTDWIYRVVNNEKVCIGQVDTNNSQALESPGDMHAMAIVGYDDTIWYDYDEDGVVDDYERGAFKLVNSHGTGYGNAGYIWVMYDALNLISNCDTMNESNRYPIFENYSYYYIEVEESDCDLIVEAELTHTKRNQMKIDLEVPVNPNNPTTYRTLNTRFYHSGGAYELNEGTNVDNTILFYFDYDPIIHVNKKRMDYRIVFQDSQANDPMYIDSFKIYDKTGKAVVDQVLIAEVDNATLTKTYRIGLVGDVDNNGDVNSTDSTRIQRYLSGLEQLTDEDKIVADIDGDGEVTTWDASAIQRKIAGIISEFENGIFVLLSAT